MARFRLLPVWSLLFIAVCPSLASPDDREVLGQRIQSLREELAEREKLFLSPAEQDHEAFAVFLKQPGTGLTRLLPREEYDGKLIARGGGAYFSFTSLTHEYGRGSDIALEQGRLSVGFAGADFGFLCDLGATPIEEATLDHPAARFSSGFTPPTLEPEARRLFMRSSGGFIEGGFSYTSRVVAGVGRTYLVRSINFERSDVLAAATVVREDSDGSLILAWKVLKRFPVPRLDPTASRD